MIVIADALRPGHELVYHPGEANARLADAFVITKVNEAAAEDLAAVRKNLVALNPAAPIAEAALRLHVPEGESLRQRRALVIEDNPTITHGGMAYGAGWRSPGFRAYADYMLTPEFEAALAQLLSLARQAPTAIMCAEMAPRLCHRSLVSDILVARGLTVRHILDARRSELHRLTPSLGWRAAGSSIPSLPDPPLAMMREGHRHIRVPRSARRAENAGRRDPPSGASWAPP